MRRLLSTAVVVPLVAAACGGGSHASTAGGSGLAAVADAAKKTIAAGSESVRLNGKVSASGQTIVLGGGGSFETRTARGSLHVHVDAGPIATSFEEVVAGGAVYLKSPVFSGLLPRGKSWVQVDLAQALKVVGLDLGSIVSPNLAGELAVLRSLTNVSTVGSERVDGVPATHYRGRVDPAKRYDVWVGSDGYVRRISVEASKPAVELTADLSSFGKAVSAAAPPAAQVYRPAGGSLPGMGG